MIGRGGDGAREGVGPRSVDYSSGDSRKSSFEPRRHRSGGRRRARSDSSPTTPPKHQSLGWLMTDYVVGPVEDITVGSKRFVNAGGVEIGVFNVNGTYHALPNHCFHQGGPLCEGKVGATIVATPDTAFRPTFVQDGEIVVCPWHGMEF